MGRFTGGEVTYLRRINTGNYEHKEFSAKITWAVDETESHLAAEEMIERAADAALGVVHQRLGLQQAPTRQPTEAEIQARAAHNADPETRHAVSVPLDAADGRVTSITSAGVDLLLGAIAVPAPEQTPEPPKPAKAAKPPKLGTVEALKDAAARAAAEVKPDPMLDPTETDALAMPEAESPLSLSVPSAAPAEQQTMAASSAAMDLPADDGLDALVSSEAVEITNDDLQTACQKTVVRINNAVKVRATITKYATQAAMIPQDKRQAFLDELAALTK